MITLDRCTESVDIKAPGKPLFLRIKSYSNRCDLIIEQVKSLIYIMQLTTIVFLFLIVYGVSCFRVEKTSSSPQPKQISSASEFYTKLEELFEAFNQNDSERTEDIFNVLKSSNSNELDELLEDKDSTSNYARGFHDYVVR